MTRHDRLVARAGDDLEYVSRPEPTVTRYVFRDRVCVGIAEAEGYVAQLEEARRGEDQATD